VYNRFHRGEWITWASGGRGPWTLLGSYKERKIEKIILFSHFFLITYPQAHSLQFLKPNTDETAQKSQKPIFKCFLQFNFATINVLGGSPFVKKIKIIVPFSTPLRNWKVRIHSFDDWIRIQEAEKHADCGSRSPTLLVTLSL
jgi:hypothetical protein